MPRTNAAKSLAEALTAAQARSTGTTSDPLVERLATALTLPPVPEPADYDDNDDDLDLPMLVQNSRPSAVIALPPIERRGREGRAALIGFGLGLILLVPIGVVMSNRLPEQPVVKADGSASALLQATVPASFVTDEVGIRTTKRTTQPVAPAASISEPTPAAPVAEMKTAIAAPVLLPPPAPALPPPDYLGEAAILIGQGDIAGARERIHAADPEANPPALLALAETFDPNMLAAWSIKGAHADVDRARLLYQRALSSGISKARQRLEALE